MFLLHSTTGPKLKGIDAVAIVNDEPVAFVTGNTLSELL